MFILVDQSPLVASGFASSLGREGMPLASFADTDFSDWMTAAPKAELQTVEAFLVGNCPSPEGVARAIRRQSDAPVIAVREQPTLETTLALFEAGADDVVRKPVSARELLARVEAVRRRGRNDPHAANVGRLKIFFDGRYPEIDEEPFPLPRRERRILEFLVANRGRWMTKQQVFAATYGLFDEDVQESVVESHISKLRRKLSAATGADPIDARRYLGYRIEQARQSQTASACEQIKEGASA